MSNNLPEYIVTIGETAPTVFDNLEAAIRHWDRESHKASTSVPAAPITSGGIEVREFNAKGDCTRSGWILHLFDGHTYLLPTIKG